MLTRQESMTTLRIRGTAALFTSAALCAFMLAGCSAPVTTSPEAPVDSGAGETAEPVDGVSASGNGEGTNGADWAPTDDICPIEGDWRAISLKLDEGQSQESSATGFAEALALADTVTPSPSIEADWAEMLKLLGGYVDVVESGDQAAIDYAYPDKVNLVEVRIRYNLAFLELCG